MSAFTASEICKTDSFDFRREQCLGVPVNTQITSECLDWQCRRSVVNLLTLTLKLH